MTEVLIVGKTKMWDKVCIGGLVLPDCRSVRLLTETGDHHAWSTRYNLREVWKLDLEEVPESDKTPPHTENVRIARIDGLRCTMSQTEIKRAIVDCFEIPTVRERELFGGLLDYRKNGKARILNSGIPNYSTGFWRLRRSLWFQNESKRYRYTVGNSLDVKYVGLEKPLRHLPEGTILRFSLSSWFDRDPGYWLQLSGWFL